jgi:hypothetical protein
MLNPIAAPADFLSNLCPVVSGNRRHLREYQGIANHELNGVDYQWRRVGAIVLRRRPTGTLPSARYQAWTTQNEFERTDKRRPSRTSRRSIGLW